MTSQTPLTSPATIDPDRVYTRAPGVMATPLNGDVVLMNPETGDVLGLNRSAAAVWDGLETPKSGRDLAARLRARFAVDEATSLAAVEKVLGDLVAAGLVVT
ncbi:PqqD family protein (plasmid) [Tistrella mobilis]|uniref:PqqD family protein n=1 Tax=Tistrella mobilis TaxID=171437 RepID=UPI0035560C0E